MSWKDHLPKLTPTQKKGLMLIIAPIMIFLVFAYFFGGGSESDYGAEVKPLFMCKRGPIIRVVDSTINSRKPCSASAKIQGIQYRCTTTGNEGKYMAEFLQVLAQKAKQRCESFCRDVSPSCQPRFRRPTSCGFRVAARKAPNLGKRVGCHWGCEGKSFAYCSIYHGAYINSTKHMLRRDPPNCRCLPR